MAAVLSKRQMTEEDIKLQFITPAITKKWALSLITMETRITDGQINLAVDCPQTQIDSLGLVIFNQPHLVCPQVLFCDTVVL